MKNERILKNAPVMALAAALSGQFNDAPGNLANLKASAS